MNTINHTYEVKATPAVVFDALVNPETIQKWSGAPAKMEAKNETDFSLFGGQIEGKTLEVVTNQKLVQKWPADTTVTITLSANGDSTTVELEHKDIPGDEAEAKFDEGWKTHYFGQLQKMFDA